MMPHLQYLKLQLQFKSKITEHLYTKRELVEEPYRANFHGLLCNLSDVHFIVRNIHW
jgi:hypothetical protein